MFYSLTRILRQIRRRRELGVGVLMAVILLAIVGNTLTFYFFDRGPRAAEGDPITVWDGFWYSLVSITTIGYGDISSTTLGARLGTAFFIIFVGLATFTTAVGMGVDWLADFRHKERMGMGKSGSRDHLIIVNFPGESRVRQIIREYRQDNQHKGRDIVLVADDLQELPFTIDDVSFVRGWPLDEETYERAGIAHAKQAIILSPSQEDPRSDSMVA
jgi:voltage-gated potassium channel